jgi:hypothetical protein
MNIPQMWLNEMYQGAVAMWPNLSREQFRDAGLDWMARQHGGGNLTVQQVALGVEQELRARFGDPPVSVHR